MLLHVERSAPHRAPVSSPAPRSVQEAPPVPGRGLATSSPRGLYADTSRLALSGQGLSGGVAAGAEGAVQRAVEGAPASPERGSPDSAHGASYASPPGGPGGVTGLPRSLRASVERLSGLSLGDVRVHHGSDKPAQLQALAYTQGSNIYVGRGQERHLPHEAWHVVQQKQGRVRPTAQLKGMGLNDQASLEAEADRMGAAAARGAVGLQARGSVRGRTALASAGAPPIQRQVTNFEATYKTWDPPVPDLIDTLDYDYFNQSAATVKSKIRATLHDAKTTGTDVPTFIEASIAPNGKGDKTPSRKTHKSGVVGKIGMDEFYLRGGTAEVFEGGHLIPHEVWSTGDPDADLADDYVNLVPMSRNMNVGGEKTWKEIEGYITGKVKSGKSVDVEIDIGHKAYELSYSWIAKLFGLSIDPGYDGDDKIKLYNWLPTGLTPKDVTGKKPKNLGMVLENTLHDTFSPIASGSDLVKALMQTPLWQRMDPTLQDSVSKL